MSRSFDRYMVQVGMGSHPKFARLTDSEFRAHIVGVLSVAALAPIRGCLLVGELEAEPADIARAAGVTVRVARSAIDKLLALGVLTKDTERGCLRVHDWEEYQPEPRTDPTGSRRQALYRNDTLRLLIRTRDGSRCRYCDVEVQWRDRRGPTGATYDHLDPAGPNAEWNLVVACRACNSRKGSRTLDESGMELLPARGSTADLLHIRSLSTPEVEGEGEVEEHPPSATADAKSTDDARQGRADTQREADLHPEAHRLSRLLADLIRQRDPKAKVQPDGEAWVRDMRLLIADRGGDGAEVERTIRWSQADSFWQGVVLSPRKLREKFTQLLLKSQRPATSNGRRENASDMLRALGGAA